MEWRYNTFLCDGALHSKPIFLPRYAMRPRIRLSSTDPGCDTAGLQSNPDRVSTQTMKHVRRSVDGVVLRAVQLMGSRSFAFDSSKEGRARRTKSRAKKGEKSLFAADESGHTIVLQILCLILSCFNGKYIYVNGLVIHCRRLILKILQVLLRMLQYVCSGTCPSILDKGRCITHCCVGEWRGVTRKPL